MYVDFTNLTNFSLNFYLRIIPTENVTKEKGFFFMDYFLESLKELNKKDHLERY